MYLYMYNRPQHNASTVRIDATNQFRLSHFSMFPIQSYFYSAPGGRDIRHTPTTEKGACATESIGMHMTISEEIEKYL